MTDIIKTERLVLRSVRAEDAQAIAAGVGDLEVSRWLTHPPHPYTLDDAQEFIAKNKDTFPELAVIEMDGEFAGLVSRQDEIGYWLAKEFWGKGVALEAARAMVDDLFSKTKAQEIGSGYLRGNNRSRKILEILGFSNVCVEKVTPCSTGVETVVQKMALSRARWEAMQ